MQLLHVAVTSQTSRTARYGRTSYGWCCSRRVNNPIKIDQLTGILLASPIPSQVVWVATQSALAPTSQYQGVRSTQFNQIPPTAMPRFGN